VASKVEQRFKQLEDKELELKKMEKKAAMKMKGMKEMEERMKVESKEWLERKEKWEEMEKNMATNAAKLEHLVRLNVGGQHFTTTKATLLQHKGSYFESLLLNAFSPKDSNGEYFIDHDSTYFGLVLDFLRDGQLNAMQLKTIDMDKLHESFKFFKIEVPLHKRRKLTNDVLDDDEEIAQEVRQLFGGEGTLLRVYHMKKITTWLPRRRFALLYKASRDGFSGHDFHRMCDNKGSSLTVIQTSEGAFLFGGYTSAPWGGTNIYKTDPTAFLFTLTNPHGIPPSLFPVKHDEAHHATHAQPAHCAVFGNGHDLFLASDSHLNAESFTAFPWSFVATSSKGAETFTGSFHFTTSEVEVYAVL